MAKLILIAVLLLTMVVGLINYFENKNTNLGSPGIMEFKIICDLKAVEDTFSTTIYVTSLQKAIVFASNLKDVCSTVSLVEGGK